MLLNAIAVSLETNFGSPFEELLVNVFTDSKALTTLPTLLAVWQTPLLSVAFGAISFNHET